MRRRWSTASSSSSPHPRLDEGGIGAHRADHARARAGPGGEVEYHLWAPFAGALSSIPAQGPQVPETANCRFSPTFSPQGRAYTPRSLVKRAISAFGISNSFILVAGG